MRACARVARTKDVFVGKECQRLCIRREGGESRLKNARGTADWWVKVTLPVYETRVVECSLREVELFDRKARHKSWSHYHSMARCTEAAGPGSKEMSVVRKEKFQRRSLRFNQHLPLTTLTGRE